MDALQNANDDAPIQATVTWKLYYKHHGNMEAPHYVEVDVTSEYLCAWMFYYTHHMYMDPMQYVHADVPSGPTC